MSATQILTSTANSEDAIAPAKITSKNPEWFIYRGIRNLLRCDEAEVVEGIAHYVISQHLSLPTWSAVMERTRDTSFPGLMALLGWARAFLSVRSGEGRAGAVWVARLKNERRAIEPIIRRTPDLNWNEWQLRARPDPGALAPLLKMRGQRRILAMVRRLHRRYEFFKVLRVVEFIAYYARYVEIFRQGGFNLALVSSHSNPHGIALNLAAHKFGVPVVLVTHGMPIRPVARLAYNLAVVHCAAARHTYAEEGSRIDRVLIHGRRQNYSAMPNASRESLRVGIFLCKDVNEQRLRRLTSELLNHERVESVLIRPHPKNLWMGLQKWIESLKDPRVILSSRSAVFDDIQQVDVVLGGNSSVLIDAVTAGRPAAFVANLDYGPADLHRFVAQNLIYGFDENWNPESMLQFYQRPEWRTRLKAFANIDEDEEDVQERAVTIMRELTLEI